MFDIKKIQELIIFKAVKSESDEMTASQIVDHPHEDDPTWVKNTMKRLEDTFDDPTIKKIRMNCQCGYGMDEKLALVNELMAMSTNLEAFGCEVEVELLKSVKTGDDSCLMKIIPLGVVKF